MQTRALRGLAASFLLACTCAAAEDNSLLQPWPGKQAPAPLALADASGKQWPLADLRGKVVVLNFWASWCSPCVEELPVLNRLADETGDRLVVLGVNYKEPSWTVEQFTREHAFRYPVLLDKTGEHFKRWTGGVMPTTVLIGRDGRPRWRLVGAIDPADARFRKAVDSLLAE